MQTTNLQMEESITLDLDNYLNNPLQSDNPGTQTGRTVATSNVPGAMAPSLETIIIKTVVMAIISASIIATNLINLCVLYKMSQIPRVTRIFLLNLSVSDLLVGIMACAPAACTALLGHWPYGAAWCQIAGVAHGTSVTLSIWSISMVGVDRYIAVTRPFAYTTIVAGKKFNGILVTLWIAAIVTFVSPILTKPDLVYYKYDITTSMCGMYWEYHIYCIITGIYIPVLSGTILTFTSCIISRSLHDQRTNQGGRRDMRNASTKKTLKILLAASTVYFICWGPYVIVVFIEAFGVGELPDWLHFTATWLANSNSMMNVIIYSLTNRTFRETLQTMLVAPKQSQVVLVMETPPDGRCASSTRSPTEQPMSDIEIDLCSKVDEEQDLKLNGHVNPLLQATIAMSEDSLIDGSDDFL